MNFFHFIFPARIFVTMFLLVWWLFQQVQWLYKVSADLHCFQLLTDHFHCSPTQKAEKQKNSIVANLSKLRIFFRSRVASENTQHFTMPPVFLRNDVWAQKFHTDDVSLTQSTQWGWGSINISCLILQSSHGPKGLFNINRLHRLSKKSFVGFHMARDEGRPLATSSLAVTRLAAQNGSPAKRSTCSKSIDYITTTIPKTEKQHEI